MSEGRMEGGYRILRLHSSLLPFLGVSWKAGSWTHHGTHFYCSLAVDWRKGTFIKRGGGMAHCLWWRRHCDGTVALRMCKSERVMKICGQDLPLYCSATRKSSRENTKNQVSLKAHICQEHWIQIRDHFHSLHTAVNKHYSSISYWA